MNQAQNSMKEKILENRIKANLANFFLVNPSRAFYFKELEKALKSRSLDQHLAFLVKADFLRQFSKKGNRYYILNRRSPLAAELKTALSRGGKSLKKYPDELEKMANRLSGLRVCVLSGLFTANPHLQCDMLLVGAISRRSLENFVGKVEDLVGQEINYALFDVPEYQFRKNIFDRFMKDIFENPHHFVIEKVK